MFPTINISGAYSRTLNVLVGFWPRQDGKDRMTVRELIRELTAHYRDKVVVCSDDDGGWDNIQEVKDDGSTIHIVFGGGSPFSDE